jgi:hypothetical protein
MSLRFDTGLAIPMRTAVRNALVQALASLRIASGGYVAAISTIPRPIRGTVHDDIEGASDLAIALQGQAPAIVIALGPAKPHAVSMDGIDEQSVIDFSIYVCSKNQRNTVEGRLYGDSISAADDKADPGVFAMLEHVRERIHAQRLPIANTSDPRWHAEDEVMTATDATVWGMDFTIAVNATINPDRDVTQVLADIEAKHNLDGAPDGANANPLVTTLTEIEP